MCCRDHVEKLNSSLGCCVTCQECAQTIRFFSSCSFAGLNPSGCRLLNLARSADVKRNWARRVHTLRESRSVSLSALRASRVLSVGLPRLSSEGSGVQLAFFCNLDFRYSLCIARSNTQAQHQRPFRYNDELYLDDTPLVNRVIITTERVYANLRREAALRRL